MKHDCIRYRLSGKIWFWLLGVLLAGAAAAQQPVGTGRDTRRVAVQGTQVAVLTDDNVVRVSSDGGLAYAVTLPEPDFEIEALAFAGTRLMIAGEGYQIRSWDFDADTPAWTEPDGIPEGLFGFILGLAGNGAGQWLAVGEEETLLFSGDDGQSWSAIEVGAFRAAVWTGSRWIAVGESSAAAADPNGVWTEIVHPDAFVEGIAVAADPDGEVLALGLEGRIFHLADNAWVEIETGHDGIDFRHLTALGAGAWRIGASDGLYALVQTEGGWLFSQQMDFSASLNEARWLVPAAGRLYLAGMIRMFRIELTAQSGGLEIRLEEFEVPGSYQLETSTSVAGEPVWSPVGGIQQGGTESPLLWWIPDADFSPLRFWRVRAAD